MIETLAILLVAGLIVFRGYTVLDFHSTRRAGVEGTVPLAAGIFLDVSTCSCSP